MKYFYLFWSSCLFIVLSHSASFKAVDNSYRNTEYPVQNAISVIITEKGFKKVASNLETVAEHLGFPLNTYEMSNKKKLSLGKEVKTEDLVSTKELKELVTKAKDSFEQYFAYTFKDHKFAVELEEFSYSSEIQDVRLEFLESSGNILKVKAIIKLKNIELSLGSLYAYDENNLELGGIGFGKKEDQAGLSFKMIEDQELRFIANFDIKVGSNGNLLVNINEIDSNIDVVEWKLIEGELLLPELALQSTHAVTGERVSIPLKKQAISDQLSDPDFRAKMLESFRAKFKSNIKETISKAVNNGIGKKGIPVKFDMVDQMEIDETTNTFIDYGITAKEVVLDQNKFVINMDGCSNCLGTNIKKKVIAKKLELNRPSLSKSDWVYVLNLEYVNNILAESRSLGAFQVEKIDEESSIKILSAPEFRMVNGKPKLFLSIEYKASGMQKIAVKKYMKFDFSLDTEFQINDGKIQIVSTGITGIDDLETFDPGIKKNLKSLFKGKAIKQIKEQFQAANWSCDDQGVCSGLKGRVLSDEIGFPGEFQGAKLEFDRIEYDSNGYILIHSLISNLKD